jgi:hypothetical protein
MSRRKTIKQWLGISIGFFVLIATAETLPPPSDKEYQAGGTEGIPSGQSGLVVKVKFNRIYNVFKQKDGFYTGDMRSSVQPQGDTYSDRTGLKVRFSQDGLGFFSKFIPKLGSTDPIYLMTLPDRGEVYIQTDGSAKTGYMAVGDQYEKEEEGGGYRWSTETEMPELAQKRKVSVGETVLFPEDVNGKIVEIEFFSANQIKESNGAYSAGLSCGLGHVTVQIKFPPEGKPFFQEIVEQGRLNNKAYSVFANVSVSPSGIVSLEAKGRRMSGSGDDAKYRW